MSKSVRSIIIKYLFSYVLVIFMIPLFEGDAVLISEWKKTLVVLVIWSFICSVEIYFDQRKQIKK